MILESSGYISPEGLAASVSITGPIFDFGSIDKVIPSAMELRSFLSDLMLKPGLHDSISEHFQFQQDMNAGEEKLYRTGQLLGEILKTKYGHELRMKSKLVVIGVLRSGWAIGRGVAQALDAQYLESDYDSSIGANSRLIPPEAINKDTTIIIVDDISFEARTIRKVETELKNIDNQSLFYAIGAVKKGPAFRATTHPIVTLMAYS